MLSCLSVGTFAVHNISATSGAPGELRVNGDFIANTSAVGMLAIVYSTGNDSDIHYTEVRLPQTEIQLAGLSGDTYSISVFTLEENGLPFNQSAHYLRKIDIHTGIYLILHVCTCIVTLCACARGKIIASIIVVAVHKK